MASTATIYGRVAASRVRSRFQYRLSFSLQILGSFLFSALDFVTILVLFHQLRGTRFGGWSFPEICFLYGSSYVTFKTADMLMTSLDKLPLHIRMGTFDQVLTRPLGTLGQILTTDVDFRHVGSVTQGLLVFVYSLVRVDVDWDLGRIVAFVLMLIGGVAIFCAIWIITNAIAFWTMDAREIANSFTYGGNMLTQFPISIYATWFRRIFAYAIPLAFVNYLPARYILGKDLRPSLLTFASPVVAAGTALLASVVWKAAVRRYRSTGS